MAHARIEDDVEQVRAVAIAAEHVEGDEAGAGEVAFVAEDAVELERMADGLVNLQHHLVGHEQHVHDTSRTVRCSEELQRFVREAPSPTRKTLLLEHRLATLL